MLKDSGQSATPFGQLVIVAASIADFGTIILLSLLFSEQATGKGTQLVLIGVLALVAVAIAVAVLRIERWMRLSAALLRLQDTTARIRVRGAFVLLALFVALAERLGLEVILGAFLAGAILKIVDRDRAMTHPRFRLQLEAAGSGFFIPFFISSGIRFDLGALFAGPATLLRVPLFLVALLLVRGLPALLYRPLIGGARVVPAGLLQATSLGFVVAAARIGQDLGTIGAATGAALMAAALLSVLLFPLGALTFLRRAEAPALAEMAAPAVAYEIMAPRGG